MEKINCDLCGQDSAELLFKVKNLRYQGKQFFNLVKCKKCGLVYLNPRPQSQKLKKYYDRYYCYSALNHDSEKEKYSFLKHCDLKRLKKYKDTGRILDIGCGKGDFLKKIKNKGWEAVGTELHPEAARYARENNELEVHEEDLSKINFSPKMFDIVRMHHVIEHLPFPLKTLRNVHTILKDDGLLIFACPNFTRFPEIAFGKKWDVLDIPRHIYQFNEKTLKRILKKTGFKTVNIYHNQLFGNFVTLKKSLFNKLNLMNYKLAKENIKAGGNAKKEKNIS